jgi:hypothetical protein
MPCSENRLDVESRHKSQVLSDIFNDKNEVEAIGIERGLAPRPVGALPVRSGYRAGRSAAPAGPRCPSCPGIRRPGVIALI